MTPDFRPRPIQIDVGQLVQRTVATLYANLVTRPTGRAVRLAIESQLAESEAAAGDTSFSLIDLSEVTVVDFSCADEVVAKLLARYLHPDRPRDAFFVFRGIRALHRDPIEVVLDRQGLAAVAQAEDGAYELLGTRTGAEGAVWSAVEERGRVEEGELDRLFQGATERDALDSLVRRRLVFLSPATGSVHALSRLVGDLV